MADEIRVLGVSRNSRGFDIDCLFLHPLTPRLTTVDGATTIVPTPAGDLPQEATALNVLDATELGHLDAGNACFERRSIFLTRLEAQDVAGAALPKIRANYAASNFVADLRSRYAHAGRKISA